ncbi:hypothetical protein ACROYT_G011890 [Oculina patagonica]
MNGSSIINPNCFFLNVNLEQTKDTFIASVLTSILNTVFSLLTSTGNVVILHVIWRKQELHSPSFILLFCLAASDLVVGVICQPFFVAFHIAELVGNANAYCAFRIIQSISSYTTTGVSLATLSGISIDRLLALTLHLRYNEASIIQYIKANYKVGDTAAQHIKTALKKGAASGTLLHTKGVGASGSFKLPKEQKKPSKKPAVPSKKPAAKAKKPVATKKTAAKKPAAKKQTPSKKTSATKAKSPSSKKAPSKKSTVKKPSATKTATKSKVAAKKPGTKKEVKKPAGTKKTTATKKK